MPGRGDGDGGVAKGHAKKRDLDDKLQVGLGAVNPDAKRRHIAGGHGQRDNDGTSNNSCFQSSGKDAKRYDTSKFPKSQLRPLPFSSPPSSPLPALQRQHSSKPPDSTGSAAKAPGANPGEPKRKQNPLPNGPPTLSSTSSDASSIPAGLTEDFPTIISKHAPNQSSRSLRYGQQSADGAAAGKDGVLPASQIRETKRHPYVEISSDDGSYVDEDEDTDDEDDDENAISFPTTRQGSARLRACSSGGSLLKGDHNDNQDGQRKTKVFSYDKTPSGKDYHVFSSECPSSTPCALCPVNAFQTRVRKCAMQGGHCFLTGTDCNMCLASDALNSPAQSAPARSDPTNSTNSTDTSR